MDTALLSEIFSPTLAINASIAPPTSVVGFCEGSRAERSGAGRRNLSKNVFESAMVW
jgi:hypothetical protein